MKEAANGGGLAQAMTLQEKCRGCLVDVPGYGKRIEGNFSGAGAPDDRVEFLFGDFLGAQFANFVVQLGHVIPPVFGAGHPSRAHWTPRYENPFISRVIWITIPV